MSLEIAEKFFLGWTFKKIQEEYGLVSRNEVFRLIRSATAKVSQGGKIAPLKVLTYDLPTSVKDEWLALIRSAKCV